jgi:hypothetical protein
MAAACAQRRFRARGAYTAMVGLALLIAGVVSTVAFTVIAAVGVVLYGSRRPVASTTGTIGRELSRGSCSIRGDWRTLPARMADRTASIRQRPNAGLAARSAWPGR